MNLTDRIVERADFVSDPVKNALRTIITEELAREGGELSAICNEVADAWCDNPIQSPETVNSNVVDLSQLLLTALTPLFARVKEENARLTKACEGEFASVEELNNETLRLRADKERLGQKLTEYSASYDNLMAVRNEEKRDTAARLGYPELEPWGAADLVMKQLQSLSERNGEMERALKNIYGRTFGGSSIRWPNARIAEECSKVLTPQPANEGKELSSGATKTEPLCAECGNPISEHTLDSTPTCPVYYKDQQQAGAVCPHGKKVSPDDFCGQCWKDYVKGKEPHA